MGGPGAHWWLRKGETETGKGDGGPRDPRGAFVPLLIRKCTFRREMLENTICELEQSIFHPWKDRAKTVDQ